MVKLIEQSRDYQRKSINRHSVRTYLAEWTDEDGNVVRDTEPIYVDRTTDALPPFFTAYTIEYHAGCNPILVCGNRYFGDKLTWKRAIKLLEFALQAQADRESENEVQVEADAQS
jgi:hypothetical protein